MPNLIVEPELLATNLGQPKIFDVRWKLGDPDYGRRVYLEGHLPGAVFVDLDMDLSGPPGRDGRHPLPDPATFLATLGRLGIESDDEVVVYDDSTGSVAARMWWMLRSIGHLRVGLLDGGIRGWIEAGLPIESGTVEPGPATYPGPIAFSGFVTIDDLEGRQLVDVRAPERYRGEFEPVDPRPGHIPGALNLPTTEAMAEGRFAERRHLASVYGRLDDPVLSCGSGVNACHSALAMVAAGLPMPDIYIGSYSEWSRSHRRVATGPEPE
jgi:thiosulfate/3-mercaptopyruvate sulfurtransferase